MAVKTGIRLVKITFALVIVNCILTIINHLIWKVRRLFLFLRHLKLKKEQHKTIEKKSWTNIQSAKSSAKTYITKYATSIDNLIELEQLIEARKKELS